MTGDPVPTGGFTFLWIFDVFWVVMSDHEDSKNKIGEVLFIFI